MIRGWRQGAQERRGTGDLFGTRLLLLTVPAPLDLETSRVAASASALVLATSLGLGADVRNGVLSVDSAEVSEDLAGTTGTLQQNSLAASGALEGELIEGHDLTASLLDAGASRLSHVEGSDGNLRDGQNTLIISDSSNDDENGVSSLTFGVADDLLERHGGSVVAGHHQTAEDHLVEVSLSTASQELVQLQFQFHTARSRKIKVSQCSQSPKQAQQTTRNEP